MLKLEISYHALNGLLEALEIASKTKSINDTYYNTIVDLKYQIRHYIDKVNGLTNTDYSEVGLKDLRNKVKIEG
jgi:uncharacterized phage infection (PIP) family protein YhgE